MIDHPRKVIFVHIPKCAGSSIEEAFGRFGSHERWKDYKGPELAEFYRFSVCRNPWDWYTSLFRYWYFMEKAYHRNGDSPLRRKRKQTQYRAQVGCFMDSVDKVGFLWKARLTGAHYQRQYSWVYDRGQNLRVDDLFKVEEIDEWWPDFAARFCLPALPDVNRIPSGRHYSAYYTDEAARRIASFYARDIAMLGYQFERVEEYDPEMGENNGE